MNISERNTKMSVYNIWCCRPQHVYFLVSQVQDRDWAWYIVVLGREFWIGPGRPTFLNRREK